MDVRCERCQTEYDFDDALVSDRGTTVKCTNCGHQFKVFPAAGAARPEIWVVRSVSGGELTYTSLGDLQRAIAQGQVTPDDLLLPKGLPPRPLRSIAELDPFFGSHRPASGGKRTLAGVAPPAAAAAGYEPVAPPPVAAARPEPFAPSRSDRPPRPEAEPERPRATTAPKLPPFDPRSASSPPRDSERPTILRQGIEPRLAAPAAATRGVAASSAAAVPRPRGGDARSGSAAAAVAVGAAAAGAGAAAAGSGSGGPAAAASALADTELFAAIPQDPPRQAAAPAVDCRAPTAGTTTLGLAPAAVPAPVGGAGGHIGASPQTEEVEPPLREVDAGAAPTVPVETIADPLPGQEPPRASPEIEPAAARREAAPALAYAPEEFFTPAPRELTFSGSLSDPDPRFVPPSRARRVRAGWIVGVVLTGGLLLLGATLGVSLVRRLAAPPPGPVAAPAPSSDPRVAAFLAEGRRALAAADVDGAAAAVTKASALAEADPAVLAALAEIETVRADFVWLRLRLLEPASTERVEATGRELRQRLERARAAVDAAAAVPVPDPSSRRLRVDLLRLEGKLQEARELVVPLAERASEPETAYVLGALDLAEETPAFRSAAARLRVAAAGEGRLGRARAALIYALARAGDLDAARRELGLLNAATSAHPLAADLGRFVDRSAAGAEPGDAGLAPVDAEATSSGPATEVGPGAGGVDFRERLRQASGALGSHDYDRAERLYRSVLAEQPENTEALAGVAEVARQRNDPRAAALYDQVLAKNPSYVPAIVARADQKWAAGDVAGALPLYQRVVAQVGADSTYGRHAAARIAEGARRSGAAGAGSPAPTAAPPPATAAPPASDAPFIDTTDLPGL